MTFPLSGPGPQVAHVSTSSRECWREVVGTHTYHRGQKDSFLLNTCSVSSSTHVITVFTKTEVSSPFYRLRQLRLREVKKFTKGVPPPKWRSWGWSTFLSPELMSFLSCPPSPNHHRVYSKAGGGGQGQSWNCSGTHGSLGRGSVFLSGGGTFFPHCVLGTYIFCTTSSGKSTEDSLACLYGQ